MKISDIILSEIKKANSILLCCHPSPDPDSVGSNLAMKFALESLGKRVTVIKGDSEIPQGFMHFPGAKDIVAKNFCEVDLKDFDLFILLDVSSTNQISKLKQVVFPLPIKSIAIDHHPSNSGFTDLSLIVPDASATGQVLFDFFNEIGVEITANMAANLFIAIYADTGGFKFSNASLKTYETVASLVKIYPEFSSLILGMQNSETPEGLAFCGVALDSVEVFLGGKLAISGVSNAKLAEKKITVAGIGGSPISISSMMNTVAEWKIVASLVEQTPGKVKCSFRTKDIVNFSVGDLATALGGGGHKAAAGATISASLEDAKKLIVSKAKELYNL
ncbi:MAG: DHH family phosphoesterase [Candidatus Taylorbacteria bacterium]